MSIKMFSRNRLFALAAALLFSIISVVAVFSAQDSVKPPVWVGIYAAGWKVGLKWTPANGAVLYKIYRSVSSGGHYNLIASTTDDSYIDPSVRIGETYYYVLKSVGTDNKESDYSEERYIKVPVAKEAVPVQPPEWVGALVGRRRIRLAWNPSASPDVLAYNVYRSADPTKGFQLIGSTQDTNLTDTDIKEGETYYYAVSALDRNFRETKLGPVQTVRYAPPEEKPGVRSVRPGAPEMPPRIIPKKLTVRRTRRVGYILRWKDRRPLFSPTDIVLGRDGKIYVSDTGDSMIQVFKPGGAFIRSIGEYGTKPGEFEKLLGVDVNGKDEVLAVDAYTGTIQKFDKKGRLIMYKKMLEDGKAIALDLGRKKPVEVFGIIKGLFAPDGSLYIIDNFNDCIEIYSSTGKYIKTFGGKGRQDGKFLSPTFAVFGKDGHLYVSDCMNARVQVFDKDGHFLWKFGGYGNIAGTFGRPKGICIDKAGNIYVSDSMSNAIQVFDRHGRFKYALANEMGKQIDMATPNGIAIDKNKDIYIVEKLVNRIQIRQVE